MQQFIKLLGEANRSTEPEWNEGFTSKGSLLYHGTEIFFFAVRLVLMEGLIQDWALMSCFLPLCFHAGLSSVRRFEGAMKEVVTSKYYVKTEEII